MFRRILWWMPIFVAVLELISFGLVQQGLVGEEDWSRAADRVKPQFRQGDLLVSAPEWTDPLLRREFGPLLNEEAAGRSDLAPYSRVWALSIRGADPAGLVGAPAFDETVGPIRVRRWDLGPSPVRYSFREHIADAVVTMRAQDLDRPCPFQRAGFTNAGGVHQGVMTPRSRHVCPSHSWIWVGATVLEDLDLQPRACIWQHPQGRDPIRTTFHDVPLGERIVFYGGLYYDHEFPRTRGPVEATVSVNGRSIGRLTHHDGDGWKRLEVLTRPADEAKRDPEARGSVSFEVTAENPDMRTFCWAATTRSGPRRPSL